MNSVGEPVAGGERRLEQALAVLIVTMGAWLRLRDLGAIEFKGDELRALLQAAAVGADPATWPSHGMLSSSGVANAPLFTWIVAGFSRISEEPRFISGAIAAINALCLYPLWRWCRAHMSAAGAMLALAFAAVSPFSVFFSRKIWTQDLLLPGVLLVLFGIDALREGRRWSSAIYFAAAVLVAGQLHQSGPIALALLPMAVAMQWAIDRRHRVRWPSLQSSTAPRRLALTILLALNIVLWLPYAGYIGVLAGDAMSSRPRLPEMAPHLLWRVVGQIAPTDLFFFFAPDRAEFLAAPDRAGSFWAAVCLGAPLAVYGIWRWLRAPWLLPVAGMWWGLVIAAFTLARIPTYPFYVLILAPVVAMLSAGGFDPPHAPVLVTRVLLWWRFTYAISLLTLTIVTQDWLVARGGARGDYGIILQERERQAYAIVAFENGADQVRAPGHVSGAFPENAMQCEAPTDETAWLVRRLRSERGGGDGAPRVQVCSGWFGESGAVQYRWHVKGV